MSIHSIAVPVSGGDMARKKRVSFDLTDEQLKGVTLGEEVSVQVTGRIISAEEGEKPSKEDKKHGLEGFPASMRLEITEFSISTSNEFTVMAEEG